MGGLSPVPYEQNFVNSYYLAGAVSGESPKEGVTGLGTAKTAEELKTMAAVLGSSFHHDTAGINNGYPVLAWQGGTAPALTGLKITTPPTRTEYVAGRSFDPTGMVVTAVYDGTVEVPVTDYTVTDGETLKEGIAFVTVQYGAFSAQQAITVLPKYTRGDVNNDGVVDDVDAVLVYAFINAKLTANASQIDAADVDGDGVVSATDAETIYFFYLGEIDSLTAHN